MSTTFEARYENGALKPLRPLEIPENSIVKLTIELDAERSEWLKASEDRLTKIWDNDADDVFNELRDR